MRGYRLARSKIAPPHLTSVAMKTLSDCHRRLSTLLGPTAEPLEVLARAEEHRHYWRPAQVKLILLAESHVYTTPDELTRTISLPSTAPGDLPRGFVRLVYCLGYAGPFAADRIVVSDLYGDER